MYHLADQKSCLLETICILPISHIHEFPVQQDALSILTTAEYLKKFKIPKLFLLIVAALLTTHIMLQL